MAFLRGRDLFETAHAFDRDAGARALPRDGADRPQARARPLALARPARARRGARAARGGRRGNDGLGAAAVTEASPPVSALDPGSRRRGRMLAVLSHPAGMTHKNVFTDQLPTLALVGLGASELWIGLQRAFEPISQLIQLPTLRMVGRRAEAADPHRGPGHRGARRRSARRVRGAEGVGRRRGPGGRAHQSLDLRRRNRRSRRRSGSRCCARTSSRVASASSSACCAPAGT